MNKPVVAIVGRTNVGKSTLLNRLAGRRISVVADVPGTTRDRVFASVSWQGRELMIIDTGGWQAKVQSPLELKVRQQVQMAVAQADVILFVVDAKEGATAGDEEIADMLRTLNKPVILTVNKVDSERQAAQIVDFHRLGIGEPIAVSAYHNLGMERLMSAILASLPPQRSGTPEVEKREELKLSIVGRPNVGKSTLLNALTGEERAIVHEFPGTTRDSIDVEITWDEKKILLIDTAGIRRRGRIDSAVEYYSLLRALQAIDRCDVALLLVDAGEFVTAQDLHIAGYIVEAGKGMIIAINKWDLIPQKAREEFKKRTEERFRFASYAPIIYISARLRQGLGQILPLAWQIWQERQKRLGSSEVDAAIQEAVASYPPPGVGTKKLRIVRAFQDESRPATFVLQVSDPEAVHFSYKRYLENRLRRRFGFRGVPLNLIFAKATDKMNQKMEVTVR